MKPEKFHHEVAPAQHEITLTCCDALHMADQLITAKDVISYLSDKHGYHAVFMPKPLNGENGSGMHINFSLANDTGKNLFADSTQPHNLSLMAQQFIAGVLSTTRECAALLNASVNSYKRLVRGYEAPIFFVAWGGRNRTALIRIPQPLSMAAVRAELRSGDLTTNPYLAFSVLLKSGMLGIHEQSKLPAETKTNLYHMTPAELSERGIDQLPASFEDALALMTSSSFLKEILGEAIFSGFLKEKNEEVAEFNATVTDWELKKYLHG